jgi:hypothetical protein
VDARHLYFKYVTDLKVGLALNAATNSLFVEAPRTLANASKGREHVRVKPHDLGSSTNKLLVAAFNAKPTFRSVTYLKYRCLASTYYVF